MSPSGAADAGGSDDDPALGHWWFLRSHQHINWRSARASSRTSLATTATRSAPLRHERDDLPSGDMSAALSASSLAPHARALRARSRRVASSPPRVRRSSRVATPSRASATAPPEEPPLPLFEGPECWRGPDLMRSPESWTHVLTSDEVAELDAALARARASNLDVIDLTPETFPLPLLAPRLCALREELVSGRGIHLFKGLPVHRYDRWQVCAAFYGMGSHIGWTCPQNAKGHVLGHVKDLGADPNDPATRIYTTCAAQPFHTDSSDIVGLLCIANSAEGGESQVVSTSAVWNELATSAPRLARTLASPFPVDRKGEVPPGKRPTYDMPVFHVHSAEPEASDGDATRAGSKLLSGIYDRNFIRSAQTRFDERDGVPRLTPVQIEALDALDALCEDDRMRLDMRLEPGDVQWLHNHTTLHARSAYSCEAEGLERSRRHLLRLWITPPNARPLPAVFAERFGSLEVGVDRGGIRVEGQKPYCALEPGA